MRFILALVVWIVFVGGLKLYTVKRDASLPKKPGAAQKVLLAKEHYTLKLTPTFSIEKDPFALTTESADTSGLELSINAKVIKFPTDQFSRGEVVEVGTITGVHQGSNEIFIRASPPIEENMLDQGIRVQLLKGGSPVVDQTIWGEQGSIVSGTISFNVAVAEGNHDH